MVKKPRTPVIWLVKSKNSQMEQPQGSWRWGRGVRKQEGGGDFVSSLLRDMSGTDRMQGSAFCRRPGGAVHHRWWSWAAGWQPVPAEAA